MRSSRVTIEVRLRHVNARMKSRGGWGSDPVPYLSMMK